MYYALKDISDSMKVDQNGAHYLCHFQWEGCTSILTIDFAIWYGISI
jgi:hypothetical protein